MEKSEKGYRRYIGVGGEEVPSMGILEGEILRFLWDAGEPLSSVGMYEAMYFARRAEKREMQSPSTIAVTLSRMVDKGLLTVERRPRGGKGYYKPTKSRAQVVAAVLNDTSRRLTGQPLGYLLSSLSSKKSEEGNAFQPLLEELRRLEKDDGQPLPQPEHVL